MSKNTGPEHFNPDFTIKHDAKKAEAAKQKLEGLRDKERKLNEELAELKKEITVTAAEARGTFQPGSSNVDGKAQKDATKELESAVTKAATMKPAQVKTSKK
jgi:hypothetical protein